MEDNSVAIKLNGSPILLQGASISDVYKICKSLLDSGHKVEVKQAGDWQAVSTPETFEPEIIKHKCGSNDPPFNPKALRAKRK